MTELEKQLLEALDERAAFELFYAKQWQSASTNAAQYSIEDLCNELTEMRNGDKYGEGQDYLNFLWEGWHARAAIAAAEATQPAEGCTGERLAAEMALSQQLAARVDDLERQLVAAHQPASAQPAAVPDTPILSDDRLHQLHWDHVGGVESVRTGEYAKHVRLCRAVEREVYAMLSAAPAQVEQQAPVVPDGFVLVQRSPDKAVCLDGGRFHGWLMYRHPDGQFVSERKLQPWEVKEAGARLAAEAKGGEA
ncbi:hypothetical protein [Chromobacterium haemolyticum]|uniref:hypothetical protein n=1 Tax=Chromobacterium haemolyticum TaxID=394935 RepID=UPI000D31721A|nr:hypothetical protein [Chromobacterium haemolyticum]PTU70812.1 hypothetical protein DBB33_15805 [Chromobacterium haemolyticum]